MIAEDKEKDSFAIRFYNLRKKKNLSQAKLSEIAGIHTNHIGRYERGLSKPASSTAKRLADVLETTVDYLMNGDINELATEQLEDRELLNLFRETEKLSSEDKAVVKKLLNAFLAVRQIQDRV